MKENKEKLNLKEALKNLKRTIKYLKPYKKQVFLNVLSYPSVDNIPFAVQLQAAAVLPQHF